MSETQATTKGLFHNFEIDSGADVRVDSRRLVGVHDGTVENRRKKPCARQYLVRLDDGGRSWYDADDVEPTGVDE